MNHYCSQYYSFHCGCYGCIIVSILFRQHRHHWSPYHSFHLLLFFLTKALEPRATTHPVQSAWFGIRIRASMELSTLITTIAASYEGGSNVYSLSTHRGTQAISWSSTEAPTVLIALSSTSQSRTSVIVEATHLVRVLAGARVVTSTVRDGQGVSPTVWRHACFYVRNTNLHRRPR